MLRALFTGMAFLLSGCLTTTEPVFDASNSQPVAEIPQFLDFLDVWESFNSGGESPRDLIAAGERGIIVDGLVVVQERNEYYAFGVVGGRPLACVIHADETIEAVAEAFGVTVEVDRSETEELPAMVPVEVNADGPPEALLAFIKDQFANQALACSMPKRGAG